jgi:hypothetical protein
MPEQMRETIGTRLLVAVLSYQLGITFASARKRFVTGRDIDPSWEAVGASLLEDLGRRLSEVPGKPPGFPVKLLSSE